MGGGGVTSSSGINDKSSHSIGYNNVGSMGGFPFGHPSSQNNTVLIALLAVGALLIWKKVK